MKELFELSTSISTPIALGGLFAGIIFLIFRQILKKNIFPSLTKNASSIIINSIINKLSMLALVAMSLGFIGYIIPIVVPYLNIAKDNSNQSNSISIVEKTVSMPPRDGEPVSTEANFGIDISYPMVVGLSNKVLEKKLNESIRRFFGIYDLSPDSRAVQKRYMQLYSWGDYLQFEVSSWEEGGVHPFSIEKALVINVENGEYYELKDLFRSGGMEKLTEMVRDELEDYYRVKLDDFKVEADANFTFDEKTIYFHFSDCEVTGCAGGPAQVEIKLVFLLDIINPNGPLSFYL